MPGIASKLLTATLADAAKSVACDLSFGVIITNRDRCEPLQACLTSLASQTLSPAWVALADLGSTPAGAQTLHNLARRFSVSYLRIEHQGAWNQALAFNTALRHMPKTTHAVQLDADMILHPDLLQLTCLAVARRGAFAVVPSYVKADAVPAGYDGTRIAFRALAAQSVGGNPLSRGGFVTLPRDWLVEYGAYDEAYIGWGFEDADLWYRIGQCLSTFCEDTGSFLLHQSHPRQIGAAGGAANPNRARYERRLAEASLAVNPGGWGRAPVAELEIRLGIKHSRVPISVPNVFRGIPLRRRERDRLRPTGMAISNPPVIQRLQRSAPHWPLPGTGTISVVLLVHEPDQAELAVTLSGLLGQTLPASEILVVDRGSQVNSARQTEAAVRQGRSARYMWCGTQGAASETRAINTALQRLGDSSATVLLGGTQWLAPEGLALFAALDRQQCCFLYGAARVVPPIARELDLLPELDWNTLASVAVVDAQVGSWWHFGNTRWLAQSGLYDDRLSDESWRNEAISRACRAQGAEIAGWPEHWIVSLACMRQEPVAAAPAGTVEAGRTGFKLAAR